MPQFSRANRLQLRQAALEKWAYLPRKLVPLPLQPNPQFAEDKYSLRAATD